MAVIGLRCRINERGELLVSTMMPHQDLAGSAAGLYIPHFADGAGYATEFILTGKVTASGVTTGILRFYSQSGEPLPLAIQ